MSVEEKALKVVNHFYHSVPSISLDEKERAWESAKQCALIVVDELITMSVEFWNYAFFGTQGELKGILSSEYWQQVKEAITKL